MHSHAYLTLFYLFCCTSTSLYTFGMVLDIKIPAYTEDPSDTYPPPPPRMDTDLTSHEEPGYVPHDLADENPESSGDSPKKNLEERRHYHGSNSIRASQILNSLLDNIVDNIDKLRKEKIMEHLIKDEISDPKDEKDIEIEEPKKPSKEKLASPPKEQKKFGENKFNKAMIDELENEFNLDVPVIDMPLLVDFTTRKPSKISPKFKFAAPSSPVKQLSESSNKPLVKPKPAQVLDVKPIQEPSKKGAPVKSTSAGAAKSKNGANNQSLEKGKQEQSEEGADVTPYTDLNQVMNQIENINLSSGIKEYIKFQIKYLLNQQQ